MPEQVAEVGGARVVTTETKPADPPDRRWMWAVSVTAIFAVTVIWIASHHEPWRDEVVPLSIARRARSLAGLTEPLKAEGHPALWYLLLWCLYSVVGQTWVLKAASIGSAIGAVFLCNRGPLPWWLTGLFTFSFFPLYQYSVISRGYSLEMLVLFGFCAACPRRGEHPLAVALLLAALANTEAFGLIMAVAAGAMLVADAAMTGSRRIATDRWVQLAVAAYVAGLALATMVAFPDASHRGTGVRQLDLQAVADGIWRAVSQPAAHSTRLAVLPWLSVWVWAYFAYLLRRPPLLCFAMISFIGIELLFNLVHGPGAPWHIGNVLLVAMATMTLDLSGTLAVYRLPARVAVVHRWLGRGLACGLIVVLASHIDLGIRDIVTDVRYDYSSSRRFGDLLHGTPELADAVIMGEPDLPLWSVSYYVDNPIYLAREETYRAWGMFVSPRKADYDLASLLAAARRQREQCRCPIVLTFGWDLDELGVHRNFPGTRFEEHFSITAEARDDFLRTMHPLAQLRGPAMTDEIYDVFVLP